MLASTLPSVGIIDEVNFAISECKMMLVSILQYRMMDNPRKSCKFVGKIFRDMDYTTVPRSLIYRERRSMEEFGAYEEDCLTRPLAEAMLRMDFIQQSDSESRALWCMNTAFYICTMVLLEIDPRWRLSKYKSIAMPKWNYRSEDFQILTLSLAGLLLSRLEESLPLLSIKGQARNHLISLMMDEGEFNPIFKQLHNRLKEDPHITGTIPNSTFAPRVIDKECIHDVMSDTAFNWVNFTKFWEERCIRDIVKSFGVSEDEKHNVIDMLRQSSHGFYSAGCNDRPEQVDAMLDNIDQEIHLQYNPVNTGGLSPCVLKEQQPDEYVTDKEVREEWMRLVSNAKDKTDGAIIQNEDAENKQKYPIKEINISFQQQLDEARKTIEEQEVTIKDLNETIKKYQMRKVPPTKRKGIALGLTPLQADIFGVFLANQLGINFNNMKEELSLILNCLFGYGRSSLANKMSIVSSKDTAEDRLYVASIFGPSSPTIAKKICSDWDENTLAPWEEDEEDSIEND